MRSVPWFVVLVLAGACLVGCGDREAAEARLVVRQVNAIDPYAAVSRREKMVDRLAHLGVETPRVREVRDECVLAHRTLLKAEGLQGQAKQALARVQGDKSKGTLSNKDAERIAQTIQQSNDTLLEASTLLPKCQAQVAKLASRYEVRR